MAPRDDFRTALNAVVELALRMLVEAFGRADWTNRATLLATMREPYRDIVAIFGEQAAWSAVRYLEQDREAAGMFDRLPDPEPADPPNDGQINGALGWTTEPTDRTPGVDAAEVRQKMAGTMNRLIRQPARNTVWNATEAAGTRFARMPVGDEGTCDWCLMLASRGAVYARDTVTAVTGRSERPEGSRYHDDCVVPGTWVSGPRTNVGYRRQYEGEVVTLVTAMGHQLTVTPNHPVLTDRGWIPAGLLNQGDNLVSSVSPERNVVGGPSEDQVPTRIEDAVRALGVMSTSARRSVPGTAEEFHGDGFDSEVDVVIRDHLFGNERHAALGQPMFELSLHGRSNPRSVGSTLCTSHREFPVSLRPSANSPHGIVGGRSKRTAFFGSRTVHTDAVRLASAARRQAEIFQPAGYDVARNAVVLGHRQHAVTGGIPIGEVGGSVGAVRRGISVARKFDPTLPYGDAQGPAIYAELGRDLRVRLAGSVHLDRLVDKRVGVFHGDVLNLETDEGWYSANGITVSNCRCVGIEIRTADDLPEINQRLEDLWIDHGGSFEQWQEYLKENPFSNDGS